MSPRPLQASLRGKLLIALVVVHAFVLLGVPLLALLAEGVRLGAPVLARALQSGEALDALGKTLALVVLAVVVNGAFGLLGALVLVRQRFVGQSVASTLVDLPLAVTPVMTGLAFLLLCGRGGPLTPFFDALGVRVPFTFLGLAVATLFVTLPFTLREVAHVLVERGTAEEEAAATLGASPLQAFWRVTLPAIAPALGTGITLTAARALGEFGAVLVLGGAISGRTQTATTFLSRALEERQTDAVVAVSLTLALVSVVLLVVIESLRGRARRREAP
jgi:sulfate transport system permease protein